MVDVDLLYRVALDYYVNKKLQREIAEELSVSRVQVSKYLSKAEELGIVRIEVIPPQADTKALQDVREEMLQLFAVEEVLISPSFGQMASLQRSLHGLTTAHVLTSYGDRPMHVGVGWGSTTYAFVQSEQSEKRESWRIVPLAGGSTLIASKFFNINHIAHAFAEKLSASAQPVYLPLTVEHSARDLLKSSSDYRYIDELWSTLDLIICSVGYSIPRSPLFRQGLLGEQHIKHLQDEGVVGDMLTHYFDINGRFVDLGIEESMINVSLQQIRDAGTKVVVAYGTEKTQSILGGLRTGLIDVLATDVDTARAVLTLSAA
jgi:deoxyribonucleoside regulator